MSRKYLIICLLIAVIICVGLSPVIAGDGTYSVNIGGIDFNIPNDYQLEESFVYEDDTTTQDRFGDDVPIHFKSVDFTDGENTISITVSTSYGDPFELEDVISGGSKTTIANKTGS